MFDDDSPAVPKTRLKQRAPELQQHDDFEDISHQSEAVVETDKKPSITEAVVMTSRR